MKAGPAAPDGRNKVASPCGNASPLALLTPSSAKAAKLPCNVAKPKFLGRIASIPQARPGCQPDWRKKFAIEATLSRGLFQMSGKPDPSWLTANLRNAEGRNCGPPIAPAQEPFIAA